MSVKDSAHLKLPLDADDKFETSSTTLELDVKPGDGDGLIAAVQTTKSVSRTTEFQNYLDDRCAKCNAYQSGNVSIPSRCFTICKTAINSLCTNGIFLLV